MDDWLEDAADDSMMHSDSSVRVQRMMTTGYREGALEVGDSGVLKAADSIIRDVAKCSSNVAFALGVEDAVRDLTALLQDNGSVVLPDVPASSDKQSARDAMHAFRKCCAASDAFKNMASLDETNLMTLAAIDPATGEHSCSSLGTDPRHSLLFVPSAKAAIKRSAATLQSISIDGQP
ncbi:hypothetical protein DIPPA_12538 [Diplonema papillatum]|nr:hypothetical protein DIPPA_12538 [Diplonema papillatum]